MITPNTRQKAVRKYYIMRTSILANLKLRNVIINALSNGDSVNLNGYVTIGTRHMAERKSRNLAENKEVTVPEHYRVCFKSGSKLNQAAKEFTQKQLGNKGKI